VLWVKLKAREGDFLETFENLIFDVKGLVHPPKRIVAFIRYFPSDKGKRKKHGVTYQKVYSLAKRYQLLRERFPNYLVYDPVFDETLCEVPVEAVTWHYKPTEKLRQLRLSKNLDETEMQALELAELLRNSANIRWDKIGVSGSVMVGLHTSSSDLDLVVYGVENCRKVRSALEVLLSDEKTPVAPYTKEDLKLLFEFRSKDTQMSFEDFVRTESRKVFQGKFLHRDYFLRFVKDWNEVDERYGTVHYVNVGYARVKATVVDDSESIFTPCKYKIKNVRVLEGKASVNRILEIVSFRGRFCEQTRRGEIVVAQGKVERVVKESQEAYYRLLLGSKPSDFMVPV